MIINVKVIPKSSKIEIIKIDDLNYKIKLTEPAERGKANEQCIEILSEYFKVRKKDIRVIFGLNKRNKRIEINLVGSHGRRS